MLNLSIQSKLPDVGETIFTEMSSLALKHNAINLGQGFPDFEMNPALVELVNKAMKDGHNQYAHRNGVFKLREAIAEKVYFLYKSKIDPGYGNLYYSRWHLCHLYGINYRFKSGR